MSPRAVPERDPEAAVLRPPDLEADQGGYHTVPTEQEAGAMKEEYLVFQSTNCCIKDIKSASF